MNSEEIKEPKTIERCLQAPTPTPITHEPGKPLGAIEEPMYGDIFRQSKALQRLTKNLLNPHSF
jgi:hypothetical protein